MSSGWVTKNNKIITSIGDCTLEDCTLHMHTKPSEFAMKVMAMSKLFNLRKNSVSTFSQAINQIKVNGKSLPQNILCTSFN